MKYRIGYLRRTALICAAVIALGSAAPSQAFLWSSPVRRWIREADKTLEDARQAESENRILDACDAYSRAHELYFKVQTESPRTDKEHVARQDAECRSRLRTLFALAAAGEVDTPSPSEVIEAASGIRHPQQPDAPPPVVAPPAAMPEEPPAPAAEEVREVSPRTVAITATLPPPATPPIIKRERPEQPADEPPAAEPVRRTWYGRRIRTSRETEEAPAAEKDVAFPAATEEDQPTATAAVDAPGSDSQAQTPPAKNVVLAEKSVAVVMPQPAATPEKTAKPTKAVAAPAAEGAPAAVETSVVATVAESRLSPRIQQMLREGAGADAVILLEALLDKAGDYATLEEQLLFAQALINRRNYKRAEAVLAPLLEKHPQEPALLMMASGLQFALGKPHASLLYLDRLLKNHPRCAAAYVNLAYTRFAMDPAANRAEAISYYHHALLLGAERDPQLELELRVNIEE